MKKRTWTKMILTVSMLAMAVMPLTAAAQENNNKVNGQVVSQQADRYEKDNKHKDLDRPIQQDWLATKGTMEEIRINKDGAYVTVTGEGVQANAQDTVVLALTEDTAVVDQNGKKAHLHQAVKKGWTVTAWYGPKLTRSIPAQGTAEKIVVERPSNGNDEHKNEKKTAGIIVNASKDRIELLGENPVILNITDETVIKDEKGNKLTADALKNNVRVEASYSAVMTKSLPPISNATSIVVKEETVRQTGTILNVNAKDDQASIRLDADSDGNTNNDIVLSINKDTTIVTKDGKELKVSELKAGQKIIGFHAQIMTMSLPPMSYAYQIVVTE
ncbi:SLAP domain-containing protein [Paenibacillus dendritiformis]|uniref:SLAP domain-containing protein n=1 Tax=Paenibacillus dendritiformis TaxID=130049 RepID=UPI00366136AF